MSIFKTPTYRLSLANIIAQEVANPFVSPVIEYFPQEADGRGVYKLSQSKKWLEGFEPTSRAPMCRNNGRDWFLFEPVQLNTDEIVVPVFPSDVEFASDNLETVKVSDFEYDCLEVIGTNGRLLSTQCRNSIFGLGNQVTTWHHLPNPWRKKENGWNKHISYYFTLSGLPPTWTNQNYNCHYLSTSNEAGAMELAGPIVSDLKAMAAEGYPAYDCTINEEVLVVSTILSFLGDSPMHAEITSTPIPGNSLHPCRACPLSSVSVKAKATLDYVKRFLMIGPSGSWVRLNKLSWQKIKTRCYETWVMAQKPRTKTKVGEQVTKHGIKDIINTEIIDKRYEILEAKESASDSDKAFLEMLKKRNQEEIDELFNPLFQVPGFDGCQDTPVEVLHVFLLGVVKYLVRHFMRRLDGDDRYLVAARYRSFDIDGLNAAPFVLFEYMDDTERELWSALCKLAPLIFQTRIDNMAMFQLQLNHHIRQFLYLLIKRTAQWVNKPKVHMLLHLAESILRFGPACLFATEKFEGYNSVLRNASVHSNRHSPGQDIGNTFVDYHNLRHLTSGGRFFDKKRKEYCAAGPSVSEVFNNTSVQRSMGFNPMIIGESMGAFPRVRRSRVPQGAKVQVLPELQSHLRNYSITQISEVDWYIKHVIRGGSFVVFRSPGESSNLGRVDHLWKGTQGSRVGLYLCVTRFELGKVDQFYRMRQVAQTQERLFISVNHNCHRGGCRINDTIEARLERQATGQFVAEVAHANSDNYVVNLAALSSNTAHHNYSDLPLEPLEGHQQLSGLHEGLARWRDAGGATGPPGPIFAIDPMLGI
ncbi:uncharacterized protein PGTG_12407 [Puccinia graminis f. sp. tritici CRL 75-36-700-3]|uniref:Uncharacterized protein n=1 Tax=Puccinia graminis f. sp. tritici (strain CRL 75-36-700-3 / race SCCL) TaxID=418459 RepID=E3KQ76_PUCGT|nr:uncharacterized protein PGTG_12407 [Puccinia graminis f. sp. tritici CRL 75-36-700-3]EFP86451.2 hypothetical protein PGTG_12407 [Puccinia graminis f. sp. tritici CRL 75-36-700-3]